MSIKGLSAPVGSLLLGTKELITKARRIRKMLGGGMRQAGILAAAGKIALTEQVNRLQTDHDNAKRLANGLSQIDGFDINVEHVQTNIVFVKLAPHIDSTALQAQLKQQGILIGSGNPLRFVLHNDVEANDVDILIEQIQSFVRG